MYKYEIYDPENKLVFVGNNKEVCERFNIAVGGLYYYLRRDRKIEKKYSIKKVIYKPEKETKKHTPTKRELTMDYIIRHLNYYGNVYMKHDPSEYLDELKKLGYRCKIESYQVIDDTEIIISEAAKLNRKRKRKHTTDYVLTRLK